MKTLQNISFIFLLLSTFAFHAQTYNTETTDVNFQDHTVAQTELNLLTAQQGTVGPETLGIVGNSVFIDQIGSGNAAQIVTESENSAITISQFGTGNNVYSQIFAKSIAQTVTQTGNNNNFVHTNPFQLDLHASEIIQTGNNINLEWYGGNSISEKLKVNMQDSDKTVIIRSFN